jgi:hypothetical protein
MPAHWRGSLSIPISSDPKMGKKVERSSFRNRSPPILGCEIAVAQSTASVSTRHGNINLDLTATGKLIQSSSRC